MQLPFLLLTLFVHLLNFYAKLGDIVIALPYG